MSDDFIYTSAGENYERVTNIAGVKTTVCKNRFEIACHDRAEINEQIALNELKVWLKRREAEMRDAGSVPGTVS